MENWKWNPDKNKAEPVEYLHFGTPKTIELQPPDNFTMCRIGVGSVEVEEDGKIVHKCRDYYDWNPTTNDWILIYYYDDVSKEWVDVKH